MGAADEMLFVTELENTVLISCSHLYVQLKQLMIVGIDCYHDITAGKRSIGALVASLNQSMSRLVYKQMQATVRDEGLSGLQSE